MTVKEIIANYLKEHGFDGLCAIECGCGIPDIMLCNSDQRHCKPAYAHTVEECLSCPDLEDCSIDLDEYGGCAVLFCERGRDIN